MAAGVVVSARRAARAPIVIDKVCPRTILAISSHDTKPMPTKSIKIDLPKITKSKIKTNIYGMDIKISTILIITLSTLPTDFTF